MNNTATKLAELAGEKSSEALQSLLNKYPPDELMYQLGKCCFSFVRNQLNPKAGGSEGVDIEDIECIECMEDLHYMFYKIHKSTL